MRTKLIFWGSNKEPVDVCGVSFLPKPTPPAQYSAPKVLKVVDHEIYATVYECNNCKKQLIDPVTITSCKVYSCMECIEYDLCEECNRSLNHQHVMYFHYGPPIEKFAGTTVNDCLLHLFRAHNGRPMLGIKNGDNFKWYSYNEIFERVKHFAAGLSTLNISKGSILAICGPNSLEYIIADYGGILCGITIVPVHVPFGQSEVDYIIKSTEAVCIICSISVIIKFLNSMKVNKSVKYIIQLEHPSATPEEVISQAKEQNIELLYFDDICTKGNVETFIPSKAQPEDLFSITFTSGSTGAPKGVMHSHKSVVAEITDEFGRYYVGMCIGPYAHSARQNLLQIFVNGGRIGLTSGDMEHLVEEIKLVNPTSLNAVPRFWNMLYTQYKNEVATLEKAYPENAAIAPALVAENFRSMLGKNLRSIVSGGAPIGEPVLNFLRMCFDNVVIFDGYASTEAGSIASNYLLDAGVEIKLENWGEYTTDDKPYPRGEICVKTKSMTMGYWKDETTTAEMFRDGWFYTGDIGEQSDDKHIRIIDRKKNLFKLAQGEFVAPETVENILLASKFVKQVFVTGSTLQSYLIAIVVPEINAVAEWAQQNNVHLDVDKIDDVYSDPKFTSAIQADFFNIGLQAQLPPFQIPRAIYVSNTTFTAQNGLLTASNKINRVNLEKEFKEIVNSIYDRTPLDIISAPGRTDEQVLDEIITQYSPGLTSSDQSIFSMGLDSISAVQITSSIKQFFNVDIKLHTLYSNPTKSGILEIIRSSKVRDGRPPSPRWQLQKQVMKDAELPVNIVPSHDTMNFLLTGATGFLGAYLLFELIKQTTANIYCLVRAANEEAATEKVINNLEYYWLYNETFRNRINVIVGDLAKPLLGLSPEEFDLLSRKIDSIYHCGAMVNGIWPYEAHKVHNVDGTLEIIKLAAKGKPKQLHHISTLSVFRDVSPREDQALGLGAITLLSGYGQSKWVAEKLCMEARARGIPVSIYRFGTISGDSTTGRSHPSDFINRLISGLAFMGIYPVVEAFVEMTPVDYAAQACVYISLRKENLGKNFHVAIPGFPVPFTDLVRYISLFGYPMKSVGYTAWKEALPRDQKNPLFALSSYFSGDFPSATEIDSRNTAEALTNASIVCPTNPQEWVEKYLQNFIGEGIIKKPPPK